MKKNIEYPMKHHSSTVLVVLLFGAVIAFCLLFCSCESKSGRLVAQQSNYERTHPEIKAVVLSIADVNRTNPDQSTVRKDIYRLKDIEAGIVFNKYFAAAVYYEVGDTILVRR